MSEVDIACAGILPENTSPTTSSTLVMVRYFFTVIPFELGKEKNHNF
jgi:hypothetical protein